jgi:hypothetical protein
MKGLQDDRAHAGREPHHEFVVGDRAMTADIAQRLRIGDRPPLKQQVAGFLLDKHVRTVVAVSAGVDCDES